MSASDEVIRDAVWLAKLARGSSWPGEMAERVERAAERVERDLPHMKGAAVDCCNADHWFDGRVGWPGQHDGGLPEFPRTPCESFGRGPS